MEHMNIQENININQTYVFFTKLCTKCNVIKNNTEFHKKKKSKDGIETQCKICKNFYFKNKRKNYIKLLKTEKIPFNLIGKQYSSFIILEKLETVKIKKLNKSYYKTYYKCQCLCGNIQKVLWESLRSGTTKQCIDCRNKNNTLRIQNAHKAYIKKMRDKNSNIEFTLNKLYRRYEKTSKTRKLTFTLDKEQFKKLVLDICYYCGDIDSNFLKCTYFSLKYNGIDRVDNSKGYELDNVVTCCNYCNKMKLNFSKEIFLDKIKKIYKKIGCE